MGRSPFRRPGPGGDDKSRQISNQTYPSEWNQYGMSMPRSKRNRATRNRSLAPVRGPDASPRHRAPAGDGLHGIVDLDPKPEHLGREAPYGGEQGIDATTRSRCAVTRATRALTKVCWALSTSRVVRWPTRASSRTPLSATSADVT